ncbi:HET-domain-containing protein [Pleomassaria siparia CBS 279.74]|uniref:HET-domain-containing protein n=1 Tax=Pleomassaria siparia CBS 279.74 TaxID=1314801 RepID=A0A6G1KQN0_9PLEO|nr:HET-domain-containing protein [Pleomassaria siparia CBS 279.74]
MIPLTPSVLQERTGCPREFLDVGNSDSLHTVVRLIDTLKVKGRYVALRHCWGQSQPYTTTRATRGRLMEGLSLHEAPATFLDAIKVPRLLGIRYLWIDSLCITRHNTRD